MSNVEGLTPNAECRERASSRRGAWGVGRLAFGAAGGSYARPL
jgi:hypothetical protein